MDGMVTGEGTLYPLLSRLQKDGRVASTWRESDSGGPPRKYYAITAKGRRALYDFTEEWSRFETQSTRSSVRGNHEHPSFAPDRRGISRPSGICRTCPAESGPGGAARRASPSSGDGVACRRVRRRRAQPASRPGHARGDRGGCRCGVRAGASQPPAPPDPDVPSTFRPARGVLLEVLAVLGLTVGAFVIPIAGPIIGICLAWGSSRWTKREKIVATVLTFLPLIVLVLGALAVISGGPGGSVGMARCRASPTEACHGHRPHSSARPHDLHARAR